jgi:hypothetical protein
MTPKFWRHPGPLQSAQKMSPVQRGSSPRREQNRSAAAAGAAASNPETAQHSDTVLKPAPNNNRSAANHDGTVGSRSRRRPSLGYYGDSQRCRHDKVRKGLLSLYVQHPTSRAPFLLGEGVPKKKNNMVGAPNMVPWHDTGRRRSPIDITSNTEAGDKDRPYKHWMPSPR